MNKRMNPAKLNIGTYYLKPYACTRKHIRDLKECGIDFVVCMQNDRNQLDLLAEYGIGAIVSGVVPSWWGGKGENAGTMSQVNKPEMYIKGAKNFRDHPAVWGIDCGDEPSAADLKHCGQILDLVDREFENQFAYLNLYANYGLNAGNCAKEVINQLGTKTYEEYIEKYCEYTKTDYICCDFYVYSSDVSSFFSNLRTVSDACLKTEKSMWIILQANSSVPEKYLSENQLRFQAFTAMAFGAKCIMWACYCPGWWYNNVLDENGNKTCLYDKLKAVNAEIKYLSQEYMKFKMIATHFSGFTEQSPLQSKAGVFHDFASSSEMIVGEMTARSGTDEKALFLFSADDPYDTAPKKCTCSFVAYGDKVTAISKNKRKTLTPSNDNKYTLTLSSNEAVFIVIERAVNIKL